MTIKKHILPTIVIAQFLCTSLWFAGNAVTQQLIEAFGLTSAAVAAITSAVQLGFIVGTLTYAAFTIPDRFHPSVIFFISAILGATANSLITAEWITYSTLLSLRFLTGFFLAGIYPVGMKIPS